MPQLTSEQSLTIDGGGTSQKVSVSTTHAESTAIYANHIVVYFDCACYVRVGASPVALGTGVDQYIPSGAHYRFPWVQGNKLSAIALTGTGTVYISPSGV